MKVKDKDLNKVVDVCDIDCPNRPCYWPREAPGVFTPGKGYKRRGNGQDRDWLCGTREIHGCPDEY